MNASAAARSRLFAVSRRQAYLEKRLTVDAPPLISNIEPTSRCNAKCRYCPRPADAGDMPMQVLERLAQERNLDLTGTWMHLRGEPLINRYLKAFIQKIVALGGTPRMSTNGLLMDRSRAEELTAAGLSQIVFSLDATTPETYRALHRSPSFSKVKQGILDFCKARQNTGTHVQVQFLCTPENSSELRDFLNDWAESDVDSLHFKPLYSRAGALDVQSGLNPYRQAPLKKTPCFLLWSTLVIRYDGTIGVCCSDFSGGLTPGKIGETSLEDVWNGPRLKELRAAHLAGQMPETCLGCVESVNESGIPGGSPLFLDRREAESRPIPKDRSVFVNLKHQRAVNGAFK